TACRRGGRGGGRRGRRRRLRGRGRLGRRDVAERLGRILGRRRVAAGRLRVEEPGRLRQRRHELHVARGRAGIVQARFQADPRIVGVGGRGGLVLRAAAADGGQDERRHT